MAHIIGDKRAKLELRRTNNSGGVSISLRGDVSSISELLKDATRVDETFKEAFLKAVLYYVNAIDKGEKKNKGEKKDNN